MSFKQFLLSRVFRRHLILAFILIFVLILITLQGLKIYTHHGKSYPVPDFSGMTLTQADETARQNNLNVEVSDSVYLNDQPPGVIVEQVPEAGFKVKQNRTVFLTYNSLEPEKITVPKLTDISFRQAQVLVENCGLQIGNISYRPSEYNDLVLKVQIDSVDVLPGQQLPKGSFVDLVVGRTEGNMATPLPDLTGMTIPEAQNILTRAMLNPGVYIYDETVLSKDDSLMARVWKQRPNPKQTLTVNLGTSVDMWVTMDSLKFIVLDTLNTEN